MTTVFGLAAAAQAIASEVRRLQQSEHRPISVAVDGRSGSGKSTLAHSITEMIPAAAVIRSDDFYSGGNDDKWTFTDAETKARDAIDWARLREEALEPLLAGRPASWHPLEFDPVKGWTGWKREVVTVGQAPVIVIDGTYSSRPELTDLLDFTVLSECPEDVRRRRLRAREDPRFLERWHRTWDEAEQHYFCRVRPRSAFDLVAGLP